MDRWQRRRWKRLEQEWEEEKRRRSEAGDSITAIDLYFDAPLRTAINEVWGHGSTDVRALAIQARVAYMTARWTFWLTVVTGSLVVVTVTTLLYTVLRDAS